jgi:hypothetical protein
MPPYAKPMMSPKIDDELHLQDEGMSVAVAGPAGDWDDDNIFVGFSAVVSQVTVNPSGPRMHVTSMGWSRYTSLAQPPEQRWVLTAKVLDNGPRLKAGGAVCSAWALYAEADGGSWVYEWRLPVMLV